MESTAEQIYRALAQLNDELRGAGDDARIRLAAIEADPDFDDEWLVLTTWELPEPPTADGWPLEELDRYCELLSDHLAALAATECLFRTSSELVDDAKLGTAVPSAA